MKKLISILTALCLTLGVSVPAFAQYYEKTDLGIDYTLSDSWRAYSANTDYAYTHSATDEMIFIDANPSDGAYSMELVTENDFREICKEAFSDQSLARNLSISNGNISVNVKMNYENAAYETINGVLYYKYEKAYTATALGYRSTMFYRHCYMTARNGYIYSFEYEKRDNESHYMDFYNMVSSVNYGLGEIKITVNGEKVYSDVSPMIVEGRTFVPIRAVAEKMGCSVSWDGTNQIITILSKDGNVLHFGIGESSAYKNLSEEIALDVAPFIVGGRTYLPVRAVAEGLNATVNWNGNTKTVIIKK